MSGVPASVVAVATRSSPRKHKLSCDSNSASPVANNSDDTGVNNRNHSPKRIRLNDENDRPEVTKKNPIYPLKIKRV